MLIIYQYARLYHKLYHIASIIKLIPSDIFGTDFEFSKALKKLLH